MKTEKQLQASRKNFLLMYLSGVSSMLDLYAEKYATSLTLTLALKSHKRSIDNLRKLVKEKCPTEEFKV